MKKYFWIWFILCIFILESCQEDYCKIETQFYVSDTLKLNLKDTLYTSYNHGITADSIVAGFMKIDTTEVKSETNPDSVYIKYDTTIFNPSVIVKLFNIKLGLKDSLNILMGDSILFGGSDFKKDFSQIKVYFLDLDSNNFLRFLIKEAVIYQDCSQW